MTRDGLLGKIVGFSLVSVVSAMLSFVVVPVSTHIYDAESLGKINFFFSVTSISLTVFCLGLDQGYGRFYSIATCEEARKRLLSFNMLVCSAVLSGVGIVAFVTNDALSVFLFGVPGKPAYLMLYSMTLFAVVLRFLSLRYRLAESVAGYTVFAGLIAIVQKGLYVLSAPFSTSYEVAIGFVALICVPMLFVSIAHERKALVRPRLRENAEFYLKEIRFSIPLLVSSLVTVLTNYVPQFAIRGLLGFSSVSLFTAALTVSLAVNLIQNGFNSFWAPYVYSHYESQQGKIMQVHEAIVMVAVTACMLLAMVSDAAFLLLDPAYSAGSRLVPFLALGPLCYTIGETAGVGINLKLKSGLNLLISFTTLVSSVVLSIALVLLVGVTGGALAVGFSALIGLGCKTLIGERFYRSIRDKSFMIRGLLPYLGVCVIALVLADNPVLRIAIDGSLLVLSFVLYGRQRVSWIVSRFVSGLGR